MKNKNIITKTQKEVADTVIFPSSLDGQIKVSGGESGVVVKPITKAIPVELPVKPEIADKEDLLIYLKYIGERLRLRDDVFINSFTKYGIVNHIITKIESSKI